MNDAIIVTVESVRTRASTNEALLTLAVPLEQAALISGFMSKIQKQIGIAFADLDAPKTGDKRKATQTETESRGEYGHYAGALHKAGFFLNPHVLEALGTDAESLAWLKTQECCAQCGEACEGDVVAAHVRRIANGAGTGIKPPFSAVPMCDRHHKVQHQHGESAVGGKEYLDKKRGEFVTAWGHQQLVGHMNAESLSEVSPERIVEWAEAAGVWKYLPAVFKK